MLLSEIDFKSGVVNIRSNINTSITLQDQVWELQEDIAAISYPFNYFIDIGWYPEFNVNGAFKIIVGKDSWEDIRFEREATLENLIDTINTAISEVSRLL